MTAGSGGFRRAPLFRNKQPLRIGNSVMTSHTGYLLMADIPGYTAYLTSSEQEHATPILRSLLTTLVEQIGEPLHLGGMEGDAILAFSTQQEFPSGEALFCAKRRAVRRALFSLPPAQKCPSPWQRATSYRARVGRRGSSPCRAGSCSMPKIRPTATRCSAEMPSGSALRRRFRSAESVISGRTA